MRTRLVAAIAAVALALGVTGAVLFAFAYNGALNPPDDSGPLTQWMPEPYVTPTDAATGETVGNQSLPLPTEADIPAGFSADERASALEWLHWADLVDDCMSDAGIADYTYSAYWQPGFDPRSTPTDGLDPAASDEHKAAFGLALYGETGGGADYHWEDAGCSGAATHEVGATN